MWNATGRIQQRGNGLAVLIFAAHGAIAQNPDDDPQEHGRGLVFDTPEELAASLNGNTVCDNPISLPGERPTSANEVYLLHQAELFRVAGLFIADAGNLKPRPGPTCGQTGRGAGFKNASSFF
jgi:hypothetical protein